VANTGVEVAMSRSVGGSKVTLLFDSVNIVLRAIATMPTSPEVRALTNRALECERCVKEWSKRSPTDEQLEATMKKILALHAAVAKLRQH